eukprot:4891827-Pleurochrysis_carterae.AAC.1
MLNTSKSVKPTDTAARIRSEPACAGIFVQEFSKRPYIPAQAPPTKFVIFTRGRSGSNFLATLINSHPAVECHMEALSKAAVYSQVKGWTVAERNANRSGFLDTLYAGNPQSRPQAVGFKGAARACFDICVPRGITWVCEPGTRTAARRSRWQWKQAGVPEIQPGQIPVHHG